jgi:hypothetical protein
MAPAARLEAVLFLFPSVGGIVEPPPQEIDQPSGGVGEGSQLSGEVDESV